MMLRNRSSGLLDQALVRIKCVFVDKPAAWDFYLPICNLEGRCGGTRDASWTPVLRSQTEFRGF